MSREIQNSDNQQGHAPLAGVSGSDLQQALESVEFQLSNVQGWVSCKRYDSAHIKAECLRDAAQKLVDVLSNHCH